MLADGYSDRATERVYGKPDATVVDEKKIIRS